MWDVASCPCARCPLPACPYSARPPLPPSRFLFFDFRGRLPAWLGRQISGGFGVGPPGVPPPPGPHLLREDPACLGHEAREGKLGWKVEVPGPIARCLCYQRMTDWTETRLCGQCMIEWTETRLCYQSMIDFQCQRRLCYSRCAHYAPIMRPQCAHYAPTMCPYAPTRGTLVV